MSPAPTPDPAIPTLAATLQSSVLGPLKHVFVGKDEIIDLMGVALAAGENLFLFGPPGTAKTALVHELVTRLEPWPEARVAVAEWLMGTCRQQGTKGTIQVYSSGANETSDTGAAE